MTRTASQSPLRPCFLFRADRLPTWLLLQQKCYPLPKIHFRIRFPALIVFTAVRRKTLASISLFLLAIVSGGLGAPVAQALERLNLRNGFSYDCARHEVLDSTHTRLYLLAPAAPAGDAAASYVDLRSDEIASTEALPDLAPVGTAKAQPNTDLHSLLTHAGSLHDIDAELLASIVHAESGGRATAISRVGALGLMQLMPGTAAALGVADALRPEENVAGGTAYFDHLLTRYHDNLALALAAYNAGPAAVDRYHGVPPFRETRAYVARVMTEFKRRKLALYSTSGVAQDSQLAQNHPLQHVSH